MGDGLKRITIIEEKLLSIVQQSINLESEEKPIDHNKLRNAIIGIQVDTHELKLRYFLEGIS
jgi:hypothetical protein